MPDKSFLKYRVAMLMVAGPQRVEVLKRKYPDLAEDIDYLAENDPTGGKQKYLQWAVNQVRKGEIATAVSVFVDGFHKRLKWIKEKDINKHKTLQDVRKSIDDAQRMQEIEELAAKPDLVVEKEDYRIWALDNQPQVCAVGYGSDWCVAKPSSSYWDRYANQPDGQFYMVEVLGGDDNEKYLAFLIDGVVTEIKDWDNREATNALDYLYESGLASDYDPEVIFEGEEEDDEWGEGEEDIPIFNATIQVYAGYEQFLGEYEQERERWSGTYNLPEEPSKQMLGMLSDYSMEVITKFKQSMLQNGFTLDGQRELRIPTKWEFDVTITSRDLDDFLTTHQPVLERDNNVLLDPQVEYPDEIVRYWILDYGSADYMPIEGVDDWLLNAIDFYARFDFRL